MKATEKVITAITIEFSKHEAQVLYSVCRNWMGRKYIGTDGKDQYEVCKSIIEELDKLDEGKPEIPN